MSYHRAMTDAPEPKGGVMPPQTLPVHDARKLTGEDGIALVILDDKTYTLRITRADKLILTK